MVSKKICNLEHILAENYKHKFYIEYSVFFTNRLAPGVIALHRLDADKERIDRFIKWYQTRLDTPSGESMKNQSSIETNIDKLLGTRTNFYLLEKYYQEKLSNEYDGNMEKFVKEEFQKLSDGIMGSAFHGLIFIGYGFVSKLAHVVCEGFAYLHHSYVQPILTDKSVQIGKGDTHIMDVLLSLAHDEELNSFVKYFPPPKLFGNEFTERMEGLLVNRGDKLLEYVKKIPEFDNECTKSVVNKLGIWILDCAFVVYSKSENRNDLYILHGVRSTWSLLQILSIYDDPNEIARVLQTQLICLFATYLTQQTPPLTANIGKETWKYSEWDELVNEVMVREELDEHVIKIVQIGLQVTQFTKDPEREKLQDIPIQGTRMLQTDLN